MPFPSTGILDSFDRANEGPPPSAEWTTPAGVSGLIVSGSLCAANAANALGIFSASSVGPNCEAYYTVTTATGAAAQVQVWARAKDIASAATIDGYSISVTEAATDSWAINSITNGIASQLGASFGQEVSNGDSIGIECFGSNIAAWYKASGGSWIKLAERTDTTYAASGYIGIGIMDTTGRVNDFGGGTTVEEGAAVAGAVGDGHGISTGPTYGAFQVNAFQNSAFQIYNAGGGASYNETGAGVAGAVPSGADIRAQVDSGVGDAGAVASGAERFAWADSGVGIAGGIASGAEQFTWTETAVGVAGGDAYGADRLSWTDTGAGIAGAGAYGAEVAALIDSGYGLADAIASGADTYTPAGGASYNETGAGIAGGDAYAVDVAALIDSGYSIAGLVPSGADALAYIETGAGIVGSDESGNDNYTGNDYGAGIIGSIASALDVAAILDSGYGLAGAVASVSDSLTTGGTASKTDYTRQSGQDVAQAQPDARAQGQHTAQNQNAARARGSKVA